MSTAKVQIIDTRCIRVYVDFGRDSEDDNWKRKQIEEEGEEIGDFVECHPMHSPDDEEGDKFWKKAIDRMKETEGVNGMIYSFVRFDMMKKMYKNLTARKVIIDCGKELNCDGEFKAMIVNLTLLSISMDEMHDIRNKLC